MTKRQMSPENAIKLKAAQEESSRMNKRLAERMLHPRFWVATVETRHFSWKGYGKDEKQAKAALLAAWHEHIKQTGGPGDDLMTDAELLADAFVREVRCGQGYRDGDPCGKATP